jgi:oxygen-independent coproporphyrinogen-3 oxidase
MPACPDPVDARLFERNLPRYAIYPCPESFHEGVGAAQFDAWIATLRPGMRAEATLQVPFCRQLCWFCACRTQGVRRPGEVTEYLAALFAEIDRTAARLPAGVAVAALHWGGGTPTILDAEAIVRLAARLRERLPAAEGADFTIEADPRSLDAERLDALAAAGVTSITLGVQDFAPAVQRAIGRRQDAAETAVVVAALRARGVGTVVIDLLYGLPWQDRASLTSTVDRVLEMRPDRIVMSDYAHVPRIAKRQRMIPEASLPGAPARLALYRTAAGLIGSAGYAAVGTDHFVRPQDPLARAGTEGRLRRAPCGYAVEPCEAVIGFGVTSISRFPQGYVQNALPTSAYRARVAAGAAAGQRGLALSLEDRIRGRAIEMLLCGFRIDLDVLGAEFGDFVGLLAPGFTAAAARFGALVEVTPAGLAIPRDGAILARAVARYFDAHAAGHAFGAE